MRTESIRTSAVFVTFLISAAALRAEESKLIFPNGGTGLAGNPLELILGSQDVRDELKLSEDQESRFAAMQADIDKTKKALLSELRSLPVDERAKRMQQYGTIYSESLGKIAEILLPQQTTRLAQIRNQIALRRFDATGGFLNDQVARALQITREQSEALEGVQQDAENEFRTELARLRRQAWDRMLSELTSEQRTLWIDLIGEPFEGSVGFTTTISGSPAN